MFDCIDFLLHAQDTFLQAFVVLHDVSDFPYAVDIAYTRSDKTTITNASSSPYVSKTLTTHHCNFTI